MFQSFGTYLKEVRIELKKVAWPTWVELRYATMVVVVLSMAFAFFIMIVDKILKKL